jgi:hypothetical protein
MVIIKGSTKPMFKSKSNDIKLNFCPISFDNKKYQGYEIPYQNNEHLSDLRSKYENIFVFLRAGDSIQCVPLIDTAPALGKLKEFDIAHDISLTKAIAHTALINLLASKGNEFASVYPFSKMVIKKEELFSKIFKGKETSDIIYAYPVYEFESRAIIPYKDIVKYGFLFNFSVLQGFNASISKLLELGLDVKGRYVEINATERNRHPLVNSAFNRCLAGKISNVNGQILKLDDSKEMTEVLASDCYLEPRHENIDLCLSYFCPEVKDLFRSKQEEYFKITGAKYSYERLARLIQWLKEQGPIKCSKDISLTFLGSIHSPAYGRDAGNYRFLSSPDCVLRPGGSITIKWPVDPRLEEKGPFDTESFPKKNVRIAAVFPPRFQGDVEVFINQFLNGVNGYRRTDKFIPYSQGFARKYRLTNCEVKLFPLENQDESPQSYHEACLSVLSEDIPYDLAIVVIREDFHKLQGKDNPYLIAKSTFMSQGVPVQEIEIETIQEQSRVYVLNNISVACYAKLGGIPWVLSSVQSLAHELVFGIGSANLSKSRLSSPERIVGITTLFSGDGNYLLSNVSKEASPSEYKEMLLSVLKDTLNQIRKRYAWQPKDKLRLIFHQSFKRYKNEEAIAVKEFIDSITDFEVEYAFVHISRSHPWRIFDTNSSGINWQSFIKGEYVPQRGCYVPLGPNSALLSLTGPYQLKTNIQGCPEPIFINLHKESTFKSLDYVAEQIFKFTFMSWRSFFPSSMPVTITYSDLIANVLGQLKDIPKWNHDILVTKLRESGWFL